MAQWFAASCVGHGWRFKAMSVLSIGSLILYCLIKAGEFFMCALTTDAAFSCMGDQQSAESLLLFSIATGILAVLGTIRDQRKGANQQ